LLLDLDNLSLDYFYGLNDFLLDNLGLDNDPGVGAGWAHAASVTASSATSVKMRNRLMVGFSCLNVG